MISSQQRITSGLVPWAQFGQSGANRRSSKATAHIVRTGIRNLDDNASGASTTLADLLMPLLAANPFLPSERKRCSSNSRSRSRKHGITKTPTAVILLKAMLEGLLTVEQVERISKGAKK